MFSKFKIILIILAIIVATFFIYDDWQKYHDKNFQVIFLNIGQGDSALIKFRNGEKMLVDCGPNNTVLARLSTYLSFFDRTIDYLVVTHPDLDHYGGCVDVLRRYKVKNIIENGDTKNDSYFREWQNLADVEGAKRFIQTERHATEIGGTKIDWLAPDQGVIVDNPDSNNRSIVFKLTDDKKSFLLTGDAEMPLENALLKKYCATLSACPALQSEYLKVGHHGSDSSSGAEWLSTIAPKVGIVSVGKNKFGHPSLRVMRNLQRVGAGILRTDEIGDITVNTAI
ncbi:MAG: hypothetical protein A3J93_03530 [Candidatus Magasanikbacteria bacterium RIFOXYC2_FULL_42_28]|uniref:Metallo-beta-lactamase domain-containing protein n=1 Tax=Candidatus Magasanikbacteria bacterium RIFOXYC2_FULL_42_28 TaxID=1798704 RepID=A0A1F6NUG8_9BACT|nr:MAG: hypothetical protein A3J93_03530 [Candidatus Magasanikbacteria bacterium RIFOXYC2_FULL_42_28]